MTARNTLTKSNAGPKLGFLARLGFGKRKLARSGQSPIHTIDPSDMYMYGAGPTTVATLLGQGRKAARNRQVIYEKWQIMESDPIISSAIQLLVTGALGGHETNGEVVFIEESPVAQENKRLMSVVDEVKKLAPLFNRLAFPIAYTAAIYGDAYARIYSDKDGIIDVTTDEMIRPQLVQPFERGGRTVGYAISLGEQNFERLDLTQMARMKMPRTQWIPQFGVVEKSLKVEITEDDIEKLPLMPSMVGGSLIYNAEEPYDNLAASLVGLVGQRWIDSIDEQFVTVNLSDMTVEKQRLVIESLKRMLQRSKQVAEDAVKSGRPYLDRVRHIIPVSNEKQITTFNPSTTARNGSVSIDDVMLHARLLAGALGVDLSMIGFADQLSGGLGEGGFFRVSAQAAERARIIRVALADFFHSIIDVHTYRKLGVVFPASERPWQINFYGSISALEAEKQRTRADAMNSGLLLVQAIQALKELGSTKEIMSEFLEKTMLLDDAQAKLYAEIVDQKPAGEEGGDFGGGLGSGVPMPQSDAGVSSNGEEG